MYDVWVYIRTFYLGSLNCVQYIYWNSHQTWSGFCHSGIWHCINGKLVSILRQCSCSSARITMYKETIWSLRIRPLWWLEISGTN